MRRNPLSNLFVFTLILAVCCVQSFGYGIKKDKTNLDSLAYVVPELRVVETTEDFRAINAGFASKNGISSFLNGNSSDWTVTVDLRRGVPTLLDGGAIPFIPGPANSLSWSSFGAGCESIQCIGKDRIESIAREFLSTYPGLFPVRQEELVIDPNGTIAFGESLYMVRFQWVVDNIPVEGASIFFRINNGNLIQVASSHIAPMTLDTTPQVTRETAWQILNGYLGEAGISEKDEILGRGKLVIIPTTLKGTDPEVYNGTIGGMASYNLAYRLVFRRPGIIGTWEAMIDAHTGEILRFVDVNRYGRIHGGIRPSDGMPPEEDRPFPYADTAQAAPNNYSDGAGIFTGNNATSTLTGKYAHINDDCGAISNTTTTGDLDFLTDNAPGTDCVVPAANPAGPGNTHSSRTLFYNLTAINLKAQTYNPSNTWLTNSFITANVNGGAWCNATSGGGTVNFYQHVAGSCNNLGEIPGVAMHEWAHSYDDEDGSGDSCEPVETYADWTAIIQTHNSCTGSGFFIGAYCDGYGDACDDCTGVRDCDWEKHAANTPWTSANQGSGGVWDCGGSGSYNGPCGWEDHCESGLSTQALWDFVYRDLPAESGMDITTAWMLEDRLWFAGVVTLTQSYTCSGGVTDGCSGTVLYSVMRALDDDGDGTANGTPHAQAIYHAMARHNIQCHTWGDGDVQNSNQTSCPSLTVPTVSGSAGNNSVTLTWTTGGASATRYFIYKNESGCDVAFNRIAIVNAPTLTYTDTGCANDVTYYYRVQAVTASDSCVSASSNCVIVTPQPCAGSVLLDSPVYNCADTVSVTMVDSNVPGDPATVTVSAWSTTDSTVKTITLNKTASSLYEGAFTTTSGAAGATQVQVADGATITVRYIDADYCGTPNVNVDATASADCLSPVITNVQATDVTGMSATITWTTNENANSRVTYGTATPPGTDQDDLAAYATSHSMFVSGLTQCTLYYFSVTSADAAGNVTTEDNGGSYFTFTTGMNVNPTYVSTDVPKSIPDNTTVNSTVAVADNKIIQDVNVTITNITHTFDGDLDIYIIAPDATQVELSTDNGSSGENFVNTVFDDSAATSITAGTAPFTGTFSPEGSLATLNGKNAAGTWTFRVADDAGGDTGTLNGWSITFTYPPQSCGTSLEYQSSVFTDVCSGTGTGGGNGYIDPGEEVGLELTLHNNGSSTATGIVGTLSTLTSGVTITDDTASFPDITADGTGGSIADHFGFTVDETVACGTVIDFAIHMVSNEGAWDDSFTITVGNVVAGGAVTVLSENFNSLSPPALPAGWSTQVITGNAWVTYNGYSCSTPNQLNYPYNSSQAADSWVFTAALSLQAGITYDFSFNQRVASGTYPENGSAWLGTSANSAGMTTQLWGENGLGNITCAAKSATFTVPSDGTYYIGFHCTSAADMWRFIIDDVVLSYTQAPSCTVEVCSTGGCTTPSTPAIGSITDDDACLQSGITINYTPGAPSTSDILVVDGAEGPALTGSPFSYNPGDTSGHTYIVRTYNTAGCQADSAPQVFADSTSGAPSAPVVTVTDGNPCLQNGVYVDYAAGAPATSHDLYVDTVLTASGISPNYFYNPGDSATHSYVVRALNGASCYTDSAPVNAADVNNSSTQPLITGIVDPNVLTLGLVITYAPGAPATRHDLYKDGLLAVTGFVSGGTCYPGNTLSHNYQIAAVNGTCVTLSDPVAATDRGSKLTPRPRWDLPELPFPTTN